MLYGFLIKPFMGLEVSLMQAHKDDSLAVESHDQGHAG